LPPRIVRVQISLDLEAHISGELLGTISDQKMMVGVIHDSFSHEGGSSHTFERTDATGLAFRTMHAARIELHYTICVWTAPIPDACVIWIELNDVYAGN
jgi:hypothetical protein